MNQRPLLVARQTTSREAGISNLLSHRFHLVFILSKPKHLRFDSRSNVDLLSATSSKAKPINNTELHEIIFQKTPREE